MIDKSYFESMPSFKDFKYWFTHMDRALILVWRVSTHTVVCGGVENDMYELNLAPLKDSDRDTYLAPEEFDEIDKDWNSYKLRPEYHLGHRDREDDYEGMYDALLAGSVLEMTFLKKEPTDSVIPRILKCLEWLHSTDFYKAPSSARYHDSFERGLMLHSLKVADKAAGLMAAQPFKTKCELSNAIFASLVHDWCKIGFYEPYMKNVKNEETGVWSQEQAYRYKDDRYCCLGHGATSMYIAGKFFAFSMEVATAIRWHMGAFNICNGEDSELAQANRQYPLVHLIQFADQLSITTY